MSDHIAHLSDGAARGSIRGVPIAEPMRVWLTGGTGLVGGALWRRLAARGDHVVAIVRPTSDVSTPAPFGVVVRAQLPDVSALRGLPAPDVIVHAAADFRQPDADAERRAHALHVAGTLALAEIAAHSGARFISLSSIDVLAFETSESPVDESAPCGDSRDYYGRTKLEGERRLLAAHPGSFVLRPPGIYGPGSRGDAVLQIARPIARRRFVHVGNCDALRSFVFVENLVDAILHVATRDVPPGVYFVDDGAPVTRCALAAAVAHSLGVSARFAHVPESLAYALASALEAASAPLGASAPLTRRGVRFRASGLPLDTSKLRATGFQPSYGFAGAVDATVRWARRAGRL